MAIDAPETNDTAEGSTSLVADVAIAALLLAMFAAILAPHWQKTAAVEQEDEHLHDIATAAGSLLSAVSLQRAEALTKGGTIKRDFDAPRTGAPTSKADRAHHTPAQARCRATFLTRLRR